jgi:undecaprenyl-diphosphatase
VRVTTLEALLLGTIQGVFMFVPVSSTSHLVLVQHALIATGSALPPPDSPSLVLFDLVVHVGTLVSIAIVFHAGLRRLVRGAWADLRRRGRSDRLHLRLVLLGLVSVAATGVVGLPLKRLFEQAFAAPPVIALMLTATGVLLLVSDRLGPRTRGLRDITLVVALAIGFAQALALLPGLSRSGLTIVAALFLGVRRRWAGEYSFFLAIPTILGASLLQVLELWRASEPLAIGLAPLAIGFAVAAVVGVGSLWLVVTTLRRARFRVFAYYVWALALVVLAVWLFAPGVVPVVAAPSALETVVAAGAPR